jgi:hypothetical protein
MKDGLDDRREKKEMIQVRGIRQKLEKVCRMEVIG